MKFTLVHMGVETAEYFDTLSRRDGFDAMLSEGFDLAVAYVLEEDKPAEHGPRMLDGTWLNEVVRVFLEIGEWVRTARPTLFRGDMADNEITDEGLYEAFRSGSIGCLCRLRRLQRRKEASLLGQGVRPA